MKPASFLSLLLFLGSTFFVLTFFIRKFAKRNRLIALPNNRSLHDVPTPKGGGLAILIPWYAGITVFYFSGLIEKNLYFALLTGVLIAIVSLLDDIFGVKPLIR